VWGTSLKSRARRGCFWHAQNRESNCATSKHCAALVKTAQNGQNRPFEGSPNRPKKGPNQGRRRGQNSPKTAILAGDWPVHFSCPKQGAKQAPKECQNRPFGHPSNSPKTAILAILPIYPLFGPFGPPNSPLSATQSPLKRGIITPCAWLTSLH